MSSPSQYPYDSCGSSSSNGSRIDPAEGSIFHLRGYGQVDATMVKEAGLNRDAMGHPCLIILSTPRTRRAVIFLITSFTGRRLEEKIPGPGKERLCYLPIEPAPPHPDTGIQLCTARPRMHKPLRPTTHVDLLTAYPVLWELVVPFNYVPGETCYPCKLDDASMETVNKHLNPRVKNAMWADALRKESPRKPPTPLTVNVTASLSSLADPAATPSSSKQVHEDPSSPPLIELASDGELDTPCITNITTKATSTSNKPNFPPAIEGQAISAHARIPPPPPYTENPTSRLLVRIINFEKSPPSFSFWFFSTTRLHPVHLGASPGAIIPLLHGRLDVASVSVGAHYRLGVQEMHG